MCKCLFPTVLLVQGYEQDKVCILCMVQYNILDFITRRIITDLNQSGDLSLCGGGEQGPE
jgi:hypothetical protein